MAARRDFWVLALLATAWMGCQGLSEPSSRPCTSVTTTTGTKTVEVTDPSNGAAAATFLFIQGESHWEGDLNCFFQHEYDRQDWVTTTIRNRTSSTISFDYTITPDPSYVPYFGTVTRLAPGGSVDIGICFLACRSFTSGSVTVTTGSITYEP